MKRKKLIMMILLLVCLLVSLMSFPLMASAADDGIYYPADYQTGKPIVDSSTGIITYHYVFDTVPMMRYFLDGKSEDYIISDTYEILPPTGSTSVGVRTYPLGVYAYSNAPMPTANGVIDVTDFKQYSQFTLSANFDIRWTFVRPADGTLEMKSFWVVYCYDSSGWYVGTLQSSTTSQSVDVSPGMTNGLSYTVSGDLKLPANTAYILPMSYTNCYVSSTWEGAKFICRPESFALDFSIDSVLENTLTMQVIKDQISQNNELLEDIKDKTDVTNDLLEDILGGDYADKEEVEQNKKDSETSVEDIEDCIDRLYAMESDVAGMTHDSLNSFLKSRPWKLVKDLVSPIMEWNHTGIIMLLVVSLVNLSVILLGR